MLTNIFIPHVIAPGHNVLMAVMPDPIWSHLATMNELIVVLWRY